MFLRSLLDHIFGFQEGTGRLKFPKKKRKKDKPLLKKYHGMTCVICGKTPCDPDHIVTKGSGGPDEDFNIWPLCRQHHTERHELGIHRFVRKYSAKTIPELLRRNWEFEEETMIRAIFNKKLKRVIVI